MTLADKGLHSSSMGISSLICSSQKQHETSDKGDGRKT
jgi:hypothetical protein